jgi:hypothetical protein
LGGRGERREERKQLAGNRKGKKRANGKGKRFEGRDKVK